MINLESLVSVVNTSVYAANQSLQEKHKELISQFFDVVQVADPDANADQEGSAAEPATRSFYRPKTVTMLFPQETSHGLETVQVDVPLLALVPMAASRIQQVSFKTQLEVTLNDQNELELAFPSPSSRSGLFGSNKQPMAHVAELEIVLGDDASPEGLKMLVEGYERALRAQIPG